MKMTQVYEILNTITKEVLGDSIVVNEDLSNIVDVGVAYENLEGGFDNYVRKLNDHIGRVVFVNRVYRGRAPGVLMDGWEFGSIMEKIRATLPEATENESWQLQDGASYDVNIFTKPDVAVKFFNNRVTYEIPMSYTDKQVKSAFSSAMQMNGFMSMIQVAVENAITINTDALIMRTINAAIGEVLKADFPTAQYSAGTGVQAVNLLYLYNSTLPQADALTASDAVTDAGFMRFAAYTIKNYIERMQTMSKLFNIGNTSKFTPRDDMHIVMLSEFVNAAEVYLYDGIGQFKDEGIKLPDRIDRVPYWQGSGQGYEFSDTSAINVVTPMTKATVNASGILGVIFDRDALGVSNVDRRVTSNYNAKGEFTNYWYKFDAGYFLDTDENCVVFFVA